VMLKKSKNVLLPVLLILVALLAAVMPAKPVAAADISGSITYHPSGSVVGTYVGSSSAVASFEPLSALFGGDTITLTFPAGTVLANIVASDFTIWAGNGPAAPSAIAFDPGARTITFTMDAASAGGSGLDAVVISTSATAAGNEIRHPTVATTSGSFSVTTTSASQPPGDTGTINNVTFIVDAANKLAFTSAPLNQNAGTQGTVTIQVQDQYGNPVTAGAYTVNLASNSTGVYHFYTTGTQNIITSINIGAGASTGTFDYYDEKPGTPTITVTDAGAVLNPATQAQTISPAAANKFVITSAPLNQNAGTQGTITVQVQDAFGNPVTAGAYTVNLASNSTGVYHFYTTGTQTVITSINIGAGVSTGTFDYYDEKAGTPTVTVSDGLTQDTQQQTINAAAANKLVITSAPLNQRAGTQGTVTVQVQDAFGNPQAAGAYTVNLASNSTGVNHFYTTGTQTVITSINIADGANSGTFDYYDEQPGTPTITVSDAGAVLTQDTQQQIINQVGGNDVTVASATGTGAVTFASNVGTLGNLTSTTVAAAAPGSPPPGVVFRHGLFSFTITNINRGATVVLTITLPSAVPVGTQYWKFQNGAWVDCTALIGDDDGDNILTLTLTDGGLGDADGIANGIIVDPGGPALSAASAAYSSSSQGPEHFIPAPARLTVKYLNVQPQQARADQPVTIFANIANSGDEADSYTATLKIDGQVEEIKTGRVGGHAAVPIQFTVYRGNPGNYSVDINGQRASFTIIDPDSNNVSKNLPLIGLIVFAVVVIAVGAVVIMRRRASY